MEWFKLFIAVLAGVIIGNLLLQGINFWVPVVKEAWHLYRLEHDIEKGRAAAGEVEKLWDARYGTDRKYMAPQSVETAAQPEVVPAKGPVKVPRKADKNTIQRSLP